MTAPAPFSAADERFMRRALALAERGRGTTSRFRSTATRAGSIPIAPRSVATVLPWGAVFVSPLTVSRRSFMSVQAYSIDA